MATLTQPEADGISEFLTGLLGLDTSLKEASPLDSSQVASVTKYVDDESNVRAAIACDIDTAAKLGAALTRVPTGGVEDAIEAGSLSGQLADNLSEVLNIGVNLFREAQSHRLSMDGTELGEPAADSFQKLTADGTSQAYEVTIANYGSGRISITTV